MQICKADFAKFMQNDIKSNLVVANILSFLRCRAQRNPNLTSRAGDDGL